MIRQNHIPIDIWKYFVRKVPTISALIFISTRDVPDNVLLFLFTLFEKNQLLPRRFGIPAVVTRYCVLVLQLRQRHIWFNLNSLS